MTKEVELLAESGGVFLDPAHVGSSIQWRIKLTARPKDSKGKGGYATVDGQVSISDCDRLVKWSLDSWSSDDHGLTKLDRAIAELRRVRNLVARAQRLQTKYKKFHGIEDDE